MRLSPILLLVLFFVGLIPVIYSPVNLGFHFISGQDQSSSDHGTLSSPLFFQNKEVPKRLEKTSVPLPAPSDIQAILDLITPSSYGGVVSSISNGIGSRVYGSEGNTQAVNYVSQKFEEFGLVVSHHDFSSAQPNVIGTLQGGSLKNNQCIIVGAHIDTYPTSSRGADDNGSGIGAVLEIARAMSQYSYNYTILFVAFNSEELMIAGSNALAADLVEANVSIAVMYNFDMILWDSPLSSENLKTYIVHNGGASASYASHAEDIGKTWLDAPVQSHLEPYWVHSDHSAFWKRNIPAVWFFEYDGYSNPYIHSIQDTTSQPSYSYEIGSLATKTAAAAVTDFATIVSDQNGFPDINFITPESGTFVHPSDQTPIFLSIDDADNNVEYLEISIGGGPWINATAGLNSTHCEYFLNTTGMYGPVTIYARAYDATGWIARTSTSFTIDRGINCSIFSPLDGEVLVQGEQTTIWVNVSDPDGRYVPTVEIRINQDDWHRASEHIRNKEYYYNLIPYEVGSITIETRVIDQNGNRNNSMVSVTVTYYPPIITDVWVNPISPLNTDPVQVYAEVTQDSRGSGIDSVLVFYSTDYSLWRPREMDLVDSDISFGLYMVTLDAVPAGSQVRFYIQAQDNFDNIVIDDNNGLYYEYYVAANLTMVIFAAAIISISVVAGVSYYVLRYRRRERPTPT